MLWGTSLVRATPNIWHISRRLVGVGMDLGLTMADEHRSYMVLGGLTGALYTVSAKSLIL